jgi:two-component system nitrate/nitrite response regulator NarL
MPGINGLEGLKMIKEKYPNQTVGMISGLDDGYLIHQAMKNGAIGWITKSMSGEPLVHAIRLMAENISFFPTDIIMKMNKDDDKLELFSDVEKRVAKLLAIGSSDKEIAGELNLPVKTVQHHVRFVLKKSDSENRTKFALSYMN